MKTFSRRLARLKMRLGWYRFTDAWAQWWERNPRPVTELVIFATREDARQAGFVKSDRLEQAPWVECWYPGRGVQGLSGRPPQRVTIPYHMLRKHTAEGNLEAILRKRQMVFGPEAIWIVL